LLFDDVVQESFLRTCRRHLEKPICYGRSFLFAVARNLALDTLRRDRRTPTDEWVLRNLRGPWRHRAAMSSEEASIRVQDRQVTPAELRELHYRIETRPEWSRPGVAKDLCVRWQWPTPPGRWQPFAARSLRPPWHKTWARVACRAHPPNGVTLGRSSGARRWRHRASRSPGCWRGCGRSRGPGGPRYGRTRAGAGLRTYHYFGYDRPVGTNLVYLVQDQTGRDLAVPLIGGGRLAMCGAGSGDRRGAAARANGLSRIANDRRFLVLPWERVPHLASHLRGGVTWRMVARFRTGARDRWKPTRADKVPPGTECKPVSGRLI